MQSEDHLTGSQDFSFLDPADFDHIQNDPNISHVMKNYIAITEEKSLKTELVLPSYEEGLNLQHLVPNFAVQNSLNANQIPSKEEFEGKLRFEVELVTAPQGKHWVYSQDLQKVFIDIDQTLPIRIKWDPCEVECLWLRSIMVFSNDEYSNEPVVRCHNHMAAENTNNMNLDQRQLKYVFRCMSQTNVYDDNGGHLSILTPLGVPQVGCDYVPLNFKFFCKNSCNSGMNRRRTEMLFTLEDQHGMVLGRRRLPVRVCSCPKRDKAKEEAEIHGKVLMKGTKKRKLLEPKKSLSSLDTNVYKVSFEIPGKENYQRVLKYAYDCLAGECMRNENLREIYKPCMDDILHKIQSQ